MNLVFIESHNRSDIPLRITGRMSFHSFELVNNDNKIDNDNRNSSDKNHIFVHPNELVFRIKEQSMKKSIYFSYRINCDRTIDQLIGQIGRQSATISDPVSMDAVLSYSDWRPSDNHTTPIVTFTSIDSIRHSNKIDLSIDVLVLVDPNTSLAMVSNYPCARAPCLRLLSILPEVFHDNKSVHRMVILSLDSHYGIELSATVEASTTYAPILSDLKGGLCHTFPILVTRFSLHERSQIDVLIHQIDIEDYEPAILAIFDNQSILARRMPHVWSEDHISFLCRLFHHESDAIEEISKSTISD